MTDKEENHSVSEIISNATINAGIGALFTYVGYSPNTGRSLNAMYKANKGASKQLIAGGLHPNVKSECVKAVKKYYKSLGRFIGQEIKGVPGSTFVDFSESFFSTEFGDKLNSIFGW